MDSTMTVFRCGDVDGDGKLFVPTFEIATCPTIRISDIKSRRFHIVDRMQLTKTRKKTGDMFDGFDINWLEKP